ncbi:hypothetical protein [Novosphingobium sp.]|uniref:hypothetical protein n=1 Tax=Novosphingobium sp. TaxID=1874826 RepID=UPI00286E442A|nr:hypothetical protein [Novosphingobium sp.]
MAHLSAHEVENDIAGRLVAIQDVLSFLLAHHLAGLREDDADAVVASFLGQQRSLKQGVIDAEDLQSIAQSAENTLAMMLGSAQHMASEYRRLRAG